MRILINEKSAISVVYFKTSNLKELNKMNLKIRRESNFGFWVFTSYPFAQFLILGFYFLICSTHLNHLLPFIFCHGLYRQPTYAHKRHIL